MSANKVKSITVNDGFIVLSNIDDYKIDLKNCDTFEKVLKEAYHLTSKDWMTKSDLRKFIDFACKENDLDIMSIV